MDVAARRAGELVRSLALAQSVVWRRARSGVAQIAASRSRAINRAAVIDSGLHAASPLLPAQLELLGDA